MAILFTVNLMQVKQKERISEEQIKLWHDKQILC